MYQVVRDNLQTLYAAVEDGFAEPLPAFVRDEFERYLACGILSRGFAWLQCQSCHEQRLVALSAAMQPAAWPHGAESPVTISNDMNESTSRIKGRRMSSSAIHAVTPPREVPYGKVNTIERIFHFCKQPRR